MAYTDRTADVEVRITDAGREALAKSLVSSENYQFKLMGFRVGRGGYVPANPVTIDAVDPADTALIDPLTYAWGRLDLTGLTDPVTQLANGETFTISDGTHAAKVFEFDCSGTNVPSGGNVEVNITSVAPGPSAPSDLAALIVTAINGAASLDVTAAQLDGVVLLTCDTIGTVGNVPIATTVADPLFVVEGMADGSEAILPFEAVENVLGLNVVACVCRLDSTVPNVQYGLGEIGIYAQPMPRGSIEAIDSSLLIDGERFTFEYGVGSVTFEFDDDATVTPGHIAINISDTPNAATVAARIVAAINAVDTDLAVSATLYGTSTVLLSGDALGIPAVAITDTVADAGFTHTGMLGGETTDQFLFAIGHFPIICMNASTTVVLRAVFAV